MGYNIYDPLKDLDKGMNDLFNSARKNMENLQNDLYQNEDAPMDYIRKIDKNLNDTIPSIERMVDILKAQSESVKSISESALSQSESAKTLAEKALSNSGVADKKSMFSIIISILSLAVAIFANADSIYINVIKILSHLGVLK